MNGFTENQDRHFIYVECSGCKAVMIFANFGAQTPEIEKEKREHACPADRSVAA